MKNKNDVTILNETNEMNNPPKRMTTAVRPMSIDKESRTLEIILTTPATDRQGDIVEPAGLDFENYLKNPVVLWAHDLAQPPVGRAVSIVESAGQVTAKLQFADTLFAREIFELYADGFLNAWSVGFIPKVYEKIEHEDGSRGVHVLDAEVVEISAVPVPANPEALTRSYSCDCNEGGVCISLKQLSRLANVMSDALVRSSVTSASVPLDPFSQAVE